MQSGCPTGMSCANALAHARSFHHADGAGNIQGTAGDDRRPQAGSPATDSGNNETRMAHDVRGSAHPVDGEGDSQSAYDLGPYECVPESNVGRTSTSIRTTVSPAGSTKRRSSCRPVSTPLPCVFRLPVADSACPAQEPSQAELSAP